MTTYLFTPPAVTPLSWYRVDTSSGSSTPAALTPPGGGSRIYGRLRSDETGRLSAPRFVGPDSYSTLYLKRFSKEIGGTQVGSPIPLTGFSTVLGQPSSSAATPWQGGTGSSTTSPRPHAAVSGIATALRRGVSTVLQNTGDSTGDEQTEWFGLLGTLLATKYRQYSVHWRQWSDANQAYSRQPTVLVAGDGGTRWYDIRSSRGFFYAGPSITGDMEVIANIRPDSWASGAIQAIVGKYDGGSNQRGWYLGLDATGHVFLSWSTDGTAATVVTAASTAIVPFTAGNPGWVRAQHIVSSSGNNVVSFFTSTDGITYTALGTSVTTAGATSHFASTSPYTLGYRNPVTLASDFFVGAINEVYVMSGLSVNANFVVPTLPEMWEPLSPFGGTGYDIQGAPVIQLWGGSQSGQNTPYMDNATRRPKVFADVGQQVLFINMQMNDSGLSQAQARGTYQTWLTNVRTLLPGVPFVCLGQNPIIARVGASFITLQNSVDQRYLRNAAILSWAASGAVPGTHPIDMFPAWPEDFISYLADANIHPSSGLDGGSGFEAKYLLQQMFGLSV